MTSRCRIGIGLIIPILLPAALAGNGGPFATSSFFGAGNVMLIRQTEVYLRAEEIYIRPVGDWVNVHAVYRLENTGADREVDYAFPIEINRGNYDAISDLDYEPEVTIMDGSVPLRLDTVVTPGDREWNGYPLDLVWYTADLHFQENETKILSVVCRVPAMYWDFASNKDFFPSFDSRSFRYMLDPAGYWGMGTADTFQCVLDFSWVHEKMGTVDSVHAAGGRWLDDDVYLISEENFDLAGADSISFSYSVDRWKLALTMDDNTLRSWELDDYRVSSHLPESAGNEYDVRCMLDHNPSTAWSEGVPGSGIGEWIIVDIPENYQLGAVAILNGYQKDRTAYESNSRAARLRCTVSFSDGRTDSRTVDLQDLTWEEVSRDPAHGMQLLWDTGEFYGIDSVRIEILDAFPGDLYDDLCISELLLFGFPRGFWIW